MQLIHHQATHQKLTGITILVVEDNDLNQEIITGFLKHYGATVTVASHGQEAIAMLNKQSFDCVLMDIQMPVMNGLEATKIIRSDARWFDLCIIAVTAYVDQHHRELCQQAGMNDFLTKPITPELLVDTILKWVPPIRHSK
ncbi:MAG: response regulator [Nitrosomonas sp.]|nr:MAG: response regulator [Nitrosomonas sp.]